MTLLVRKPLVIANPKYVGIKISYFRQTNTDRHRHTDADSQTDRHTDRQTDRQTDRC